MAFRAVKFWRVEEPVARMLAKVPRPLEVKLPPEPVVKKRLVEEAVVEKRLVVVAEVEVELRAVKFWRVVDAVVWSAPVESIRKSSVPAEFLSWKKLPPKLAVLEATMRLPVVVVAKRPRRALVSLSDEAPIPMLVVTPLG